ncbi:unnamed protein product [Aphis gossypii]|uniref:Uncharacterized protein n=1 Tax=Aphis gossypii TaxID=80765 RepID=A0A9P0NMB5_APHGO|nr:unnamed protein product [Aphis gossypii]
MASDGGRCVARPQLLQWKSFSSLLLARRSYYHGRFVLRATDRRERYLHHTRKPAVPSSPYGRRRSVCVPLASLQYTAVVVVVAAATVVIAFAVVVTVAVMARFVVVGSGDGCFDDGRTLNQYWKRQRDYYDMRRILLFIVMLKVMLLYTREYSVHKNIIFFHSYVVLHIRIRLNIIVYVYIHNNNIIRR